MYRELLNLHREKSLQLINKAVDFAVSSITTDHAIKETDKKNEKFQQYVQDNNDNVELIIEDFMRQFLVPNVDR